MIQIDPTHISFIYGCMIARKPYNILELGVGTGLTTQALIKARNFNGRGIITCVDNWSGYGGTPPDYVKELSKDVIIITAEEEDFVENSQQGVYDFLVFDADHFATEKRIARIFSMAKINAFLFFHDVTSSFTNLSYIIDWVKDRKYPYYVFNECSRPDEECSRGLLFVMNL
jgi:predicted O-methyltransferase YrrM